MLEIYNEEIRDLLGKGPPAGKKHQITHDERAGTSVSFLEAVDCRQPGRVADLLARAARARSVGATAANEQSSRSHMVFSMHILGTHEASGQTIRGETRYRSRYVTRKLLLLLKPLIGSSHVLRLELSRLRLAILWCPFGA